MKCLVIVAHPDDETIWMGGYILKNPDFDWEIISLCRGDDSDRLPRFKEVCSNLGAKCAISDLEDVQLDEINVSEVVGRIKKMKKSKSYDYIFTHGENGEYGHLRHEDVHHAVNEMISNGDLKCKEVYYFAYEGENKPGQFCNVDKSATKFINLPKDVYEKKRRLIKDVYGFDDESFEVMSTQNVEAFNIEKK